MRSEIKSAIIVGIIVLAAIGGISTYFNSLDMPKTTTIPIQSNNIQVSTNQTAQTNAENPITKTTTVASTLPPIDESHNVRAPDLAGISGYINTTPEDLKNAMKNIQTRDCL